MSDVPSFRKLVDVPCIASDAPAGGVWHYVPDSPRLVTAPLLLRRGNSTVYAVHATLELDADDLGRARAQLGEPARIDLARLEEVRAFLIARRDGEDIQVAEQTATGMPPFEVIFNGMADAAATRQAVEKAAGGAAGHLFVVYRFAVLLPSSVSCTIAGAADGGDDVDAALAARRLVSLVTARNADEELIRRVGAAARRSAAEVLQRSAAPRADAVFRIAVAERDTRTFRFPPAHSMERRLDIGAALGKDKQK